ncbi:hypothetical protein SC09_contig4orf00042 [Bacillus subtilis]|uniref:Uncharacterized protein n=1 Tax=Bacillus subtilis TaxID=1423 RepID=A0A0D1IZ16_BACIU|nr:hypothetical protein SC09_contig4orf00042 [Bacillus subtilis]
MIAEQAPIAGGLSHPPTLPLYRMKARLAFVHMRNKKRGKETRASPFVFRKALHEG